MKAANDGISRVAPLPPPAQARGVVPPTVLIVDDNEANRYLLERCVKTSGCRVIQARTAGECLAQLSMGRVDLIILDVNLPDTSGVEVCRSIKSAPSAVPIPVILVSAVFTEEDHRIAGLETGADIYLSSPVNPRELLAHVTGLLRLREAEERLRLTVELSPQVPWTAAPDGSIEGFSERWTTLTGFTHEELLGHAWSKVPHPDDLPGMLAAWSRALATGEPYDIEHRIRTADGTYRWMRSRAFAHRDDNGSIIRWYGYTEDIHSRVEAQHALRVTEDRLAISEERLRMALKAGGAGAWDWDIVADSAVVSDSYRELFGFPRSVPVTFETWLAAVHPEDRQRCKAYAEQFFADPSAQDWNLEFRIVTPHRGVRWHHATGRIFRSEAGAPIRSTGVSTDVTQRKRMEETVRESEERFRVMADGLPLIIWVHDAEGRQQFVNRTFGEFFGVNTAEMDGERWKDLMHPLDSAAYAEEFASALQERRPFLSHARVRRADGEWRWIESYGRPRHSESGQFLGMVGTSVDITERKRAEALLARDKEALENLVRERTSRLQELVNELEHFSYTITHDMRAPLRAMRGFAEVLNEPDANWSAEERSKFVNRIVIAAERMDSLITDALQYSRMVRQELPVAPVDVNQLLRGMLETYPELQDASADIVIEHDLPIVMGNEAGLTQCFSNLLINALKFSKPGERPQVRVGSQHLPGVDGRHWVRLWVQDHGVGIAPAFLPRVFDMFARGSNPSAGTGIGLALVRKVADRMGGRVGVESEPGKGTRFWIDLQAAANPRPSQPSQPSVS